MLRNNIRKATTKIVKLVRKESLTQLGARNNQLGDEIIFLNAKEVYLQGNYGKALYCFEKVKESFLQEHTNKEKLAEIDSYLNDLYSRVGKESVRSRNYFAALSLFEKLKALKESKGDAKGVVEVQELISNVYKLLAEDFRDEGKYKEAIVYTEKRKEIAKKINKPMDEINQELEELYLIKANEFSTRGNYKISIEFFEKVKEIYIEKDYNDGLLDIYKVLGKLYFETNQIRNSIQNFVKLRDLAEYKQDYLKKMHAFEHIGICYQIFKDYKTALNNFKMLLQLAWKENNIEMELIAYDYMGIQYFYMGDLEGARYYNSRVWNGITEKMTSPTREISNKALEAQKSKAKINVNKIFVKNKSANAKSGSQEQTMTVEIGLPSPRTSSGEADLQYLPIYPSKDERESHSRSKSLMRNRREKVLNKTVEVKKANEGFSHKVRPFILLSHLSPIQSVKNFFYADQMNFHK